MSDLSLDAIIWQVVASIPEGRVATYGQIARLAGSPRHARYVGATLRKLPKGSSLPWYRVVNARGEISFPQGGGQYEQQRALLEAEDVTFYKGKLSLKIYGWQC